MNETTLHSKAADMEVANSSRLSTMCSGIESLCLSGSSQTLQRDGESLLDKQLSDSDKSRLHRDKHPVLKPLRCQAAELRSARVTGSLKHPFQRSGEVPALTGSFELCGVPATPDSHRKFARAGGTRSLAANESDLENARPDLQRNAFKATKLNELWVSKQWKLPSGAVNTVRPPSSELVAVRSPQFDGRALQHISRLNRSASDPGTSMGPRIHDDAKLGIPKIALEQVREERLRSLTLLAASRANFLAAGPSSMHSSQQIEKGSLGSLLSQHLETIAVADA